MAAEQGLIFNADGSYRSGWSWPRNEPCPYTMEIEPGGHIVHLQEALGQGEWKALAHEAHVTRKVEARHVKERLELPASIRAQAGETLAYRPALQRVVSRAQDGRETVKHDFKAGR
jgi:hypothetical protein